MVCKKKNLLDMKKYNTLRKWLVLLTGIAGFTLWAQDTSATVNNTADCNKWLSLEHEFVKAKNYNEALPTWEKLHKQCPDFNKVIYIDGVKIYKGLINQEKDQAKKEELIRKMISLYDERIQYFPQDKPKVLHIKGIMMTSYKFGTPEERYEVLNEVFTKYPDYFTHPKAYLGLFQALVAKYKKGEITQKELFDEYDDLTEHLDKTMEKLTKEFEELKKKDKTQLTRKEKRKLQILEKNLPAMNQVYSLMDRELGELGNCETLVPYYSKNFKENRDNIKWLKRSASRLAAKECTNNKLFKDIVEALYKKEPSATSAKFLAIKYKKEGNYSKALQYFKNAAQLETNKYEKAKLYYYMAVIAKKMGQKSKARSYAYEALKYKPSMGHAYLLIAALYANSANECGNTKFEKTAIFWKAAEMARKAASIDPTIRKQALNLAAEYEKRAPSKQEVFLQGMGGKIIKFDKCWVGGSVRVPSN
jgi:tetratricopeptide (TPR) repeat protein